MKKLFILFFIIILNHSIFSQSNANNIFVLPQGYPIGELNGLGISGLVNNPSNIGAINPATLNNFSNFSIGVSYQFETSIKPAWLVDLGYKKVSNFIPQSAGVIYPYKNFRFGLSMFQRYNGVMDLGPIPVTDSQHPDGTGQFIDFEEEFVLYNYSIIASYSFEKIFNSGSISIGGRFDIDKMDYSSSPSNGAPLSFSGNSWSVGSTFKLNTENNKYLQLGLFYEKNINLTGHREGGLTVTPTPDSLRVTSYKVFPLTSKFPARLKFDFDVSTLSKFKFLGSISEIFWNDINANSSNITELAGSVVYQFNNMISSSLGFFYTREKYNTVNIIFNPDDPNNNLKAYFITLGTVINFNNINIDISLADSHLLSGNWRKQTIGKIGVGYVF